jgi:hypothetical protein
MNEKPDNAYCFWCGRYFKHLMPHNKLKERVCPVCDEDPDYQDHLHRNLRIANREARMIVKGHNRPTMVYNAD